MPYKGGPGPWLGFIAAGLFGQPVTLYLPHLAIDMIVWAFISVGREGCNAFTASA